MKARLHGLISAVSTKLILKPDNFNKWNIKHETLNQEDARDSGDYTSRLV